MFTVCPGCSRQFHIYAEHIAAAGGQVRCGFCHTQFNALDRLSDEPFPEDAVIAELEEEPQFEILPESQEPETKDADLDNDILISTSAADHEQELQRAIDEIDVRPTLKETSLPPVTEQANAPPPPDSNDEPDVKTLTQPAKETRFDFPDPEELLETAPPKKSLGWQLFWSGVTFLALITIAAQLVWFNRDWILLNYPQLHPYAKQICQEFNCNLIRQRDAKAIKLINHDIRLHPRFEDTLLVNATMVNELDTRQPYPRVQLVLFDTSDALLAYRNFSPTDYLDSSIDLDQGMPVNSPVHFVLEVSGPASGAFSYEFIFL